MRNPARTAAPSRVRRAPHSPPVVDTGVGLDWLIDTTTILAAAETYLLIRRLTGWNLDTYQGWLATTFARLTGVADENS